MISAWGVSCILAQGLLLRLVIRFVNDKAAILLALADSAVPTTDHLTCSADVTTIVSHRAADVIAAHSLACS
jgi:hypothetical protein